MENFTDIEFVFIRDDLEGIDEQLPSAHQPEKLPVIKF